MPTATATFKIASWKEEPYATEPQKMTLARVDRTFEGGLEGESHTEYLMAYGTGDASFVGHERFTGKLNRKEGSFVFQREGTAGAYGVRERFFIVPGSGTGELEGISGKGTWESGHAEEYPMTFEYEL